MLFVFSEFPFADMRQAVVLVVLREVETDLFTECRHAHGDETVDKLIAQPAHDEGVDEHDDDGQQMIEENRVSRFSRCMRLN